MVKVRLYRTGTRKRASYRIVAIDSRKARQGRVLEFLGTYEPVADGRFHLKQDALDKWVGKGAQVSDTVKSLIRRQKAAEASAS